MGYDYVIDIDWITGAKHGKLNVYSIKDVADYQVQTDHL
jgi:hypothetical protein